MLFVNDTLSVLLFVVYIKTFFFFHSSADLQVLPVYVLISAYLFFVNIFSIPFTDIFFFYDYLCSLRLG
jgi:hypothetical protein